ncbi:hypothetical protein AAGV37_00630 [Pseudomonas protegens]|uniref:hypothetical protein n=1 Tax=Pseudomonas protegens TaxID=380021 RepID=UPI003158BD9B
MKKHIASYFLLFVLTACGESVVKPIAKPVDGDKILLKVISSIDHDHPGRGVADYPSDEPVDVPKSYAMILLGAVEEAREQKRQSVNEFGSKAGKWLINNADANGDGVIGWGVPIAWDAYGDGSVNPENTEYAISTAIVVDALLGWVDYVDDKQKQEILALVERALEPYLPSNMRTPAGLLPYSLLVQDRKYDTFNSAVYLAGQMQRYAEITKRPELRDDLRSAADATMAVLIQHKKNTPNSGSWYWDYSIQEDSPNDLPHAGYIIEGILTYIANNGRLASSFDKDKVFSHLMDFFGADGKVRGWPAFRPRITTPARLYDVSIASQLMCRFKDPTSGNLFLGEVERYEASTGGYLKYPNGMKENKRVAEYEAYLYRALMACGFNVDEKY